MIELKPEIFSIIEKKFVLNVFSEEYLSHIDIGFDTLEELEAATIGLSLQPNTLKSFGEVKAVHDMADLRKLFEL